MIGRGRAERFGARAVGEKASLVGEGGVMDQSVMRLLGGRYRFQNILGEGAMSTVSRAHDGLLGRTVAVKLLKPAFGHDGGFVERFYAEARMAARIVDPRVVSIYDIVSDGSLHALVMEYVDGLSLAAMLRLERRFAEPCAIDYARQIANALAAAHAQQIVHCDLKPANVLVNGKGLVKVADFGLAKAMGASDRTEATRGGLVGSVHYFSPEQAQGLPLGPAADLYSLGIMLYQFCAGTPPYSGDSPAALALAHVDEPVPAIATLRAFMSPGLAQIVHRLLQKDPQARFGTTGELDAALAQLEMPASPAPTAGAYGIDAPTLVGRVTETPLPTGAPSRSEQPASELPAPRRQSLFVAAALSAAVAAMRYGAAIVARMRSSARVWLRRQERTSPPIADRRIASKRWYLAGTVAALPGIAVLASSLRPAAVAVADVRRTSLAHARSTLAASGLDADVIFRGDERVASGMVIAEKPVPGSTAHRGDRIALYVSSGLPMVAIPNLVGLSFQSAVQQLRPAKLRVRYAAALSQASANTVIEQVPPAGTRVREGSNAIVIISTGAQPLINVSGGDGSQ